MVHGIGTLHSRGYLEEAPGSHFQIIPALAVVTIWGANQQEGNLCISPSFFLNCCLLSKIFVFNRHSIESTSIYLKKQELFCWGLSNPCSTRVQTLGLEACETIWSGFAKATTGGTGNSINSIDLQKANF